MQQIDSIYKFAEFFPIPFDNLLSQHIFPKKNRIRKYITLQLDTFLKSRGYNKIT